MGFSWPNPDEIENITDHQRDALRTAFRTRICCLEGPPGSGKSWTARAAIAHIRRHQRYSTCIAAAPTGKAAVRIQEYLIDAGVGIWCGTQHRLLGVQRNGHGDGDWDFIYRRDNPLPADVLLLDEQSMSDTPLMSQTLEAVGDHTHVMLIGDAHQLPPVGHGRPFADLLDLPRALGIGRLNEIHRNSGEITWTCKLIRDKGRYDPPTVIDEDLGLNIAHVETRSGPAQIAKIKDLISHFRDDPDSGINPVSDVQVIVARNESGQVNREKLNESLQEFLNPDGVRIENVNMRVGDKVICTKNGFYKDAEFVKGKSDGDGSTFISNGDTGIVKHVTKQSVVVQFQAPARLAELPVKGGPIDLAYAVTCHKMQGSQARVIIIVVDETDRNVCSRQWWYTAISRSQDLCFVVGKKSAVQMQVMRQQMTSRKTLLKTRIKAGLPKEESETSPPVYEVYRSEHLAGTYTGD